MAARKSVTVSPGVVAKHDAACPAVGDGARCSCKPALLASVWDARYLDRDTGKRGKFIRKTFTGARALTEAKDWRADTQGKLRRNEIRAASAITFRAAAEEWMRRAKRGAIRNRSGDEYKPSALREYQRAFDLRLVPALGAIKLSDVTSGQLQQLVGDWQAGDESQGRAPLSPSAIRNTINAARVLYRHSNELGAPVMTNPTIGLRLPAVRGSRDRVLPPDKIAAMLAALPTADRALWATALYAGLRQGELRALRWEDVDIPACRVRVARGWDHIEGPIEPKSEASARVVPILPRLVDALVDHKIATGRSVGLVFGRDALSPFNPGTLQNRADKAWEAAGSERYTMHELRHTFVSLMIAAGVHIKAISTYAGHANIQITLDRYGHLLPGDEDQHGAQLEAFLEAADTSARLAQLDA